MRSEEIKAMNNQLINFIYGEATVRTVTKDGEPWFVLKDVCDVLELDTTKLKQVADRLDDDEKGRCSVPTLGGEQETTIISESGLYRVVMRSDKPQAKPFQKWVTAEVLPPKGRVYIADLCEEFKLEWCIC
jgi:prophage antirepressor-like protein